MSEILMVVPPEWVEIPDAPSRVDEASLAVWLTNEPIMIETVIEDTGIVQPGYTIVEGMKVPTSDGSFRLFVRLAPV